MTNKCLCGKLTKTKNNQYCSRKCSSKFRRRFSKRKIMVTCEICKKEFSVYISQYANGRRKYCSVKCKNKRDKTNEKNPNWRGGKITRTCKMCGEEFKTIIAIVKYGYGKYCSHSCKARWIIKHIKNKDTKIERLIEEALMKHNIPYKKQYCVEKIAVVDFYLPNKVIIQCDGNYWHSLKENIKRDMNQDFILRFKGYKIYRFTETQINKSPSWCIKQILKKEQYGD